MFSILPLLLGGSLGKILTIGLSFAADLALKLIGFILYLASEYWGRWVLFGVAVCAALLYGRYHYIQEGRQTEARFRDVLIDKAFAERCQTLKKRKDSWILPEGWPGG